MLWPFLSFINLRCNLALNHMRAIMTMMMMKLSAQPTAPLPARCRRRLLINYLRIPYVQFPVFAASGTFEGFHLKRGYFSYLICYYFMVLI